MTFSSSMKLVSATTWTSGWAALIRPMAPMPSSCGMTKSIRTTSGLKRRGQLNAGQPVVGLAHDLDVVEQLEIATEAAPDDPMIVDEEDPDHVHSLQLKLPTIMIAPRRA